MCTICNYLYVGVVCVMVAIIAKSIIVSNLEAVKRRIGMVKYLIVVSMLVFVTCTGGMRMGIGSGSGTTNISLEQQLELLEWAVDDAVFTLEREHGKWDTYNISATFSHKSLNMSDYTYNEAMDVYIELTNIWINSSIQDRCQLMVNWQRM